MPSGYAIGIDFGTTNSSLAILRPGEDRPELVRPRPRGMPYEQVLGTEVYFPGDGQRPLVGRDARNEANRLLGHDYLRNFKQHLTRQPLQRCIRVSEITGEYWNDALYQCMQRQWRRTVIRIGTPYTRVRFISAIAAVLDALSSSPEVRRVLPEADRITFGLPVMFGDLARMRLLQAAVEARIVASWSEAVQKIRFLQEPVAIALDAYQSAGADSKRVLVYDHGGGTLDLTLLEYEPGADGRLHARKLLHAAGFALGGCYFDEMFRKNVVEPRIREVSRTDAGKSDRFWVDIQTERLKIDLSKNEFAKELFPVGEIGATREELNRAVAPLVEQCVRKVEEFLVPGECAFDRNAIDVVVLAGGMSCMPCVQEAVAGVFDSVPNIEIYRPDPTDDREVEDALTHTARGLATYGRSGLDAERTVADIRLVDSARETIHTLIPRDTDLVGRAASGSCEIGRVPRYPGFSLYFLENHIQDDLLIGYVDLPLPAGDGDRLEIRIHIEKGQRYPSVSYRWVSGSEWMSVKSLHELPAAEVGNAIYGERSELPCTGAPSWRLPGADLRPGDLVRSVSPPGDTERRLTGYITRIDHVGRAESVRQVRRFDCESYRVYFESERRSLDNEAQDYRTWKVCGPIYHLDLAPQRT